MIHGYKNVSCKIDSPAIIFEEEWNSAINQQYQILEAKIWTTPHSKEKESDEDMICGSIQTDSSSKTKESI